MAIYNLIWQQTDAQLLEALLLATGGEGGATLQDVLLMADVVKQRQVIQHYVSSIKWEPSDKTGKEGTYALQFFPEVIAESGDDGLPGLLETPKSPAPIQTKTPSVLSEGGMVLSVSESAPRTRQRS